MRELANPWRQWVVHPGRVRLALTKQTLARLGRVNFLDLPLAGAILVPGVPIITVEAQNWVGDVTLPIGGRLVATNPDLRGLLTPGSDPRAWLLELAVAKDDLKRK